MKRIIFGSLLSLLLVALNLSTASAEFNKTKIAVLDFQLQGVRQDSGDMGKIVAEWLITALVKEGRFDVIERRLLEKVLEEQKMHASGLVDEGSASKLGKVLGAKIVITGSVMKYQDIMEVNARIIEVETSSIIAAESVKSANVAKLEDLVVQMADKIIGDFPLEGYIVQREGDNALIDLGKRAGVKPGMQFVVYKEGRVIKHPKTGEVLDIERIETGTVEIIEVKTKTADARIIKENENDAISAGQLVKNSIELPRPDSRKQRQNTVSVSYGAEEGQLSAVYPQIEELRRLKMGNDRTWKKKYKDLDRQLDVLEKQNKKSPDVYLARARVMEAIDKLEHAEKYINKALSVRSHYPGAYVLRGDIYIWDSLKPNPVYGKSRALKRAIDGYEDAAKHAPDKDFEAEIYLKMGNAYNDLGDDKDKAKEFWRKAAETAPGSSAARTAREKMNP